MIIGYYFARETIIGELPAFESIMQKMETYFWEQYDEIGERLKEEGLI